MNRADGPVASALVRRWRVVAPRRFSREWWLVLLIVTLVIGSATYFALRFGTALSLPQLFIYWVLLTVAGDIVTAVYMERVAPTRVALGPGDRRSQDDLPSDVGTVLSDFDERGMGRIRIRGETWRARGEQRDLAALSAGARVRVLDRVGLTLVVAPESTEDHGPR